MKKLFTTIFILLAFYSISSAQQDPGTIQFGVNAGFNYSYVTSTEDGFQDSGLKTGFNVGVSANYYFSEIWSLKIGASYDQKGWGGGSFFTTDQNGNITETDGVTYKLNYITIPVLANWHLGSNRQWYVDFGPYVGILTSANADGTDVKSLFNTTDGGFEAGTGIQIPIGERTKLFIELDGQEGVVNLDKSAQGFGTITNQRESLNIGINF